MGIAQSSVMYQQTQTYPSTSFKFDCVTFWVRFHFRLQYIESLECGPQKY